MIQGKTVLLNSVQVQLIETEAWLLLFFFMFTQSMFWVQKLEKVDSSSRLKNEWLLLSASFTAKFGLFFV